MLVNILILLILLFFFLFIYLSGSVIIITFLEKFISLVRNLMLVYLLSFCTILKKLIWYTLSFRLTTQGCLRIIELPHQKGVFLITYVFNLVFDILYVLCLVLYNVSPLFI